MVQRTARNAALSARDHALAVLRVRNSALALALLPAAVAAVLFAAGAAGAAGALRWPMAALAGVCAAVAAATGALIARARPAVTPTIEVPERAAPALHGLIRDLAHCLDVPPPSGIALTPDCDSWLEEPPGSAPDAAGRPAPVLVIGSPFLWWMRVAELRAVLAPVVAGTGPSGHPDIASARRCVRAWDATAGLAAGVSALRHPLLAFAGRVARLLLRVSAAHGAEMERGVAVAASARAQDVDQGLRIAAQEQVGLAYAGWDRLLTRVAMPAWRIGRWPRRLDAGVVAALTELSRRDRLADGFAARLGERPACDLLEEPGAVDEEISLLAARLFHGGPAGRRADWAPVDWAAYPEEVVDRIWRDRAARLFTVLDAAETPTLACALERLAEAAVADSTETLAARLGADAACSGGYDGPPGGAPLAFPPAPPRSDREVLVEHVCAAVCCAAADTTGAAPGLDWLDGPVLLADGHRRQDLFAPVHSLVDDGDPGPLRDWLTGAGVREDKPVRLV
ncbi:hypothetical protein [Streptomyces litchfieldiae]|uniref:Integral membrane protein n=1 Tax=Streptomyces litchfieldiae TaxID=3075543 RepID=A0ABU2MU13_9ACTN|nr:hypothetical protein [Streptomyces sp. DSM 44938]MDT0345030.1 hypothetical protein [Streptomyces sp. DSM 44938]